MKIQFTFRWPVKQMDATSVEMELQRNGKGLPILNPDFVAECKLSDGEIESAEIQVIREVAIIK